MSNTGSAAEVEGLGHESSRISSLHEVLCPFHLGASLSGDLPHLSQDYVCKMIGTLKAQDFGTSRLEWIATRERQFTENGLLTLKDFYSTVQCLLEADAKSSEFKELQAQLRLAVRRVQDAVAGNDMLLIHAVSSEQTSRHKATDERQRKMSDRADP